MFLVPRQSKLQRKLLLLGDNMISSTDADHDREFNNEFHFCAYCDEYGGYPITPTKLR